MSWIVHRHATDEDYIRLERTCENYVRTYLSEYKWLIFDTEEDLAAAKRLGPCGPRDTWYCAARDSIHLSMSGTRSCFLRGILTKRIRRALGDSRADGIEYNTVGRYGE
jgi:hypothetical protein